MNGTPRLRLALRAEGNFWNAYVAQADTMEGALLIGSIAMTAVQNRRRKRAFMELMTDSVKHYLSTVGATVTGFEERPAPQHERAGRA